MPITRLFSASFPFFFLVPYFLSFQATQQLDSSNPLDSSVSKNEVSSTSLNGTYGKSDDEPSSKRARRDSVASVS